MGWNGKAVRMVGDDKAADLELLGTTDGEALSVALDDLVVVAEFCDTISASEYQALQICRGGRDGVSQGTLLG
jgi:hypothetical protein